LRLAVRHVAQWNAPLLRPCPVVARRYKGNNDDIVAGLELPNIIPGFDDAGAHCTILTDATCATTNLQYVSYSALRHHKYTLRRAFLHYNQPFLTTTNLSVILTITDFNQNAPRRYYGKDRVAGNGKTLPLETIIKTQTMDAARIFGLEDRGVLAAGMRADLNIIDMEKLKVRTTIKQ